MSEEDKYALRQFVRDLYQDSITSEDARDFLMEVQESLQKKIESWGETVMSPEEYMAEQEAAAQTAKDRAEYERLGAKLGK